MTDDKDHHDYVDDNLLELINDDDDGFDDSRNTIDGHIAFFTLKLHATVLTKCVWVVSPQGRIPTIFLMIITA